MLAACCHSKIVDLWAVPKGLVRCSLTAPHCRWNRAPLRVDLGQSQSGSSSLSPRAYRAEDTIAELAISEILPITSVRAPRYCGGRSLRGAKVSFSKGGRTDRWPQMTAIPSRKILLRVKVFGPWVVLARCCCGTVRLRRSRPWLGPSERPWSRNRERLAGGAGGGNERPCSPARCGRNPWPGCTPQATNHRSSSLVSPTCE